MHPFTPGTFRTMYPSGRSYLFDMGAGHWDEGSLTWFITVWGRRGIVFDEIYGARVYRAAADVCGMEWSRAVGSRAVNPHQNCD